MLIKFECLNVYEFSYSVIGLNVLRDLDTMLCLYHKIEMQLVCVQLVCKGIILLF